MNEGLVAKHRLSDMRIFGFRLDRMPIYVFTKKQILLRGPYLINRRRSDSCTVSHSSGQFKKPPHQDPLSRFLYHGFSIHGYLPANVLGDLFHFFGPLHSVIGHAVKVDTVSLWKHSDKCHVVILTLKCFTHLWTKYEINYDPCCSLPYKWQQTWYTHLRRN